MRRAARLSDSDARLAASNTATPGRPGLNQRREICTARACGARWAAHSQATPPPGRRVDELRDHLVVWLDGVFGFFAPKANITRPAGLPSDRLREPCP